MNVPPGHLSRGLKSKTGHCARDCRPCRPNDDEHQWASDFGSRCRACSRKSPRDILLGWLAVSARIGYVQLSSGSQLCSSSTQSMEEAGERKSWSRLAPREGSSVEKSQRDDLKPHQGRGTPPPSYHGTSREMQMTRRSFLSVAVITASHADSINRQPCTSIVVGV